MFADAGKLFAQQKGDVAAIADLFPFTNFFANAPQVSLVSLLGSSAELHHKKRRKEIFGRFGFIAV